MSIFSLFLLITNILSIYSQNCNLPIRPTEGDTVICNNTCNQCLIICDTINQCKSVEIYSGALSTIIECLGESGCNSMSIYAGVHELYPPPYSSNNFARPYYDFVQITCSGKISCLGMAINVNGNFINGGVIFADSNGLEAFKDAFLRVSILETQIFGLFCGTSLTNCDGTGQYRCISGICQCNGITRGLTEGCASLAGKFSFNSNSPTQAVFTLPPTTADETNSECNQQTQPIIPRENEIIVCNNKCSICVVHCPGFRQCWRTRIYSGALNTIIKCDGEQSCGESQVYIGKTGNYPEKFDHTTFERNLYNHASIDCSAKLGCVKASIVVDGNFRDDLSLNADGNGEDSFKAASLDVAMYDGQTFNLFCGLVRANCEGALYTCRGGSCLCNDNPLTNNGGCQGIASIITASRAPTSTPTNQPSRTPTIGTISPTAAPTEPTEQPTTAPTKAPSKTPSKAPTKITESPTPDSTNPTKSPTITPSTAPTTNPTRSTNNPTLSSETPTNIPTEAPTPAPTNGTDSPTVITIQPTPLTSEPSLPPTSTDPTLSPTNEPTNEPTLIPTDSPTLSTINPTVNTDQPTPATSNPTSKPSISPSVKPSPAPIVPPTKATITPTEKSNSPTESTVDPTNLPTNDPTTSDSPTIKPTQATTEPSIKTTLKTTSSPHNEPTNTPTIITMNPTPPPVSSQSGFLSTIDRFKTTIIVFTIITGLMLIFIGLYYFYHTVKRKKEASNDEVSGLSQVIPKEINKMYNNQNNQNNTKNTQNTKDGDSNERRVTMTSDVEIKYSSNNNNQFNSESNIVLSPMKPSAFNSFKTDTV